MHFVDQEYRIYQYYVYIYVYSLRVHVSLYVPTRTKYQ